MAYRDSGYHQTTPVRWLLSKIWWFLTAEFITKDHWFEEYE